MTLDEIKNHLMINNHVNISSQSVSNALKLLKITKKITYTNINVNSQLNLQRRKEYSEKFLNNFCDDENKIKMFIDESSFDLYLRRVFGRSIYSYRPSIRGRKVSLILAISSSDILNYNIVNSSVNSNVICEFLEELITVCRGKGILSKCLFIFDNVRIHHTNNILNILDSKNCEFLHLSPYSYMLNPIEYSFSKIKDEFRKLIVNRSELSMTDLIRHSVDSITVENLSGYFRHMKRNCYKALSYYIFN